MQPTYRCPSTDIARKIVCLDFSFIHTAFKTPTSPDAVSYSPFMLLTQGGGHDCRKLALISGWSLNSNIGVARRRRALDSFMLDQVDFKAKGVGAQGRSNFNYRVL